MKYRRRKTQNSHDFENPDRWLLSYADLITLLLALFVVLYAAANQPKARNMIAQALNGGKPPLSNGNGILPGGNTVIPEQTLVESVLAKNSKFSAGVKIKPTTNGFIISLSEAGFFASGEAEISAEASNLIDSLAVPLKDSKTLIRVEGHTDSTPISTARFPSNWELSTARAAAVLTRLLSQNIRPARLSAAGYGSEQPIADNSTPEGRAQNRRVDIVVTNR
jgi:chemotaxis protein MotB